MIYRKITPMAEAFGGVRMLVADEEGFVVAEILAENDSRVGRLADACIAELHRIDAEVEASRLSGGAPEAEASRPSAGAAEATVDQDGWVGAMLEWPNR